MIPAFNKKRHKPSSSTWLILASGFAVFILVACLSLLRLDFFVHLENGLSDRILCMDPGRKSGRVVIVDIDEETLNRFGQWPWPRYRIARLIERIRDAGASAVGVNMLFPEVDRTSPKELESSLLREQDIRIDLSQIPRERRDYDETLAAALARSPSVLGFEFLFSGSFPDASPCLCHPVNVAWINPSHPEVAKGGLFEATGALCSIDRLSRAARSSGFLNPIPDTDGTVRRSTLLIRCRDRYYPSLALATVMEALDTKQVLIHLGRDGVEAVILGDKAIPVDSRANLLLHYRGGAGSFDTIPAHRVLSDGPLGDSLTSKVVFLGTSAVGLYENLKTPFDLTCPNVDVHATVADTILKGDFIARPHWGTTMELLATLVGSLSCIFMLWFGPFISGAVTLLGAFGFWGGAIWLLESKGLLLSPLYPIMAVTANYAFGSVIKYWHRERGQRREKEEALLRLKASERTLDSILKTIPDIVYRLNGSGEITFINQAISHYGYDPAALPGTRFLDLLFPEDRAWAERRINERRTGVRATAGVEVRILVGEGATLPGESGVRHLLISSEGLYSRDVPDADSFIGSQGIGRDITERKRLETQLVQAEKMEALGTLAGGIAHDFNNLLTGIQGNASLLLMEKGPSDPQVPRIRNIETYVKKGAHLTRQLLGLGRQEHGDVRAVHLNRLIQENLELFQRTRKDVQVHTAFHEGIWTVLVDRGQIEQVLLNLFVNAWQAMPEGGELTVETANTELGPEDVLAFEVEPGRYVRVSVRDNGVGMDAETLSRVFDPFFTTKGLGVGTGLGLSSAYGIIRKHRGFIRADSEKGAGTTFDVFLPASDDLPEGENRERDTLARGREIVLLVDDEEMVLDVASAMLRKLGYTVRSASGGEAALDLFSRTGTDVALVILDLIMPGMSGIEAFRRLKEIDPRVKVLFASGYSLPKDAERLSREDHNGFIQKPYRIQDLSLKVREILDA